MLKGTTKDGMPHTEFPPMVMHIVADASMIVVGVSYATEWSSRSHQSESQYFTQYHVTINDMKQLTPKQIATMTKQMQAISEKIQRLCRQYDLSERSSEVYNKMCQEHEYELEGIEYVAYWLYDLDARADDIWSNLQRLTDEV